DLIRLSGLQPGLDIDIQYTGVRPGEKLFEELSLEDENTAHTRHPRILIGRLRAYPLEEISAHLQDLRKLAETADPARIQAKRGKTVRKSAWPKTGPADVPPPPREPKRGPFLPPF